MECSLSEDSTEVSHYIARYFARKFLVRSKCEDCAPLMVNHTDPNSNDYLNLVSRGGLIDPSQELAHFVALILSTTVRKFSTHALEKYAPIALF